MEQNKVNQNKVSYNFGVKGWGIIGMEVVLLFFMTGMTVDGLNIIVPQVAEFRGWDPNQLLGYSTPAGIIALLIVVFWGKFITKWGLKKVTVITMFLAAAATIGYGNANSTAMYVFFLICMVTLINAFALTCGMSICANWFPTQKGVVMGLTTIGMNLASALINRILNALSGAYNIAVAISVMGVVIAIIGVLVALLVKGTPEEAGCYPDNDPEVAKLIQKEESMIKEEDRMGYGQALKNPKVWVLGIAYGFFGLATVGIMSQLVSFFMETKGYELPQALNIMTIAAVIGIVGSWHWGVVDQKIGTKMASVLFGIWYFVGIILLLMPGAAMYVGIFMLGFAIGGNGNFAPSMASYVFGRQDFAVSYSCMNMIVGIVRSCSFIVLALLRARFSGYNVPYMVFAVIALVGGLIILGTKVHGVVGHTLEEGQQ